jgi:hypothetical protein
MWGRGSWTCRFDVGDARCASSRIAQLTQERFAEDPAVARLVAQHGGDGGGAALEVVRQTDVVEQEVSVWGWGAWRGGERAKRHHAPGQSGTEERVFERIGGPEYGQAGVGRHVAIDAAEEVVPARIARELIRSVERPHGMAGEAPFLADAIRRQVQQRHVVAEDDGAQRRDASQQGDKHEVRADQSVLKTVYPQAEQRCPQHRERGQVASPPRVVRSARRFREQEGHDRDGQQPLPAG